MRSRSIHDPNFAAVCHCRSCQRYTGSAFEPLMVFPNEAVRLEGELKTYDDKADSGKFVHRRFCSNCGSGVIAEADAMPGVTIVLAGSLDDPSFFKPSVEIFCVSAQPWTLEPSDQRKRFDRMPG